MSDKELIALCRELDAIECEMRHLEAHVTRIRMRFRERVSPSRQSECGFIEGQDDGHLRPRLVQS
jgi:hypothetical protein